MERKIWQVLFLNFFFLFLAGCEVSESYYFQEPQTVSETVSVTEAEEVHIIKVHMCGAVQVPGVVEVPEGSRVLDGIEAAGGFSPEAAVDRLNLAEYMSDGERIYVPFGGEENAGLEDPLSEGKVNLNTATKEELMTLPGIGEARADAILAFRKRKGRFSGIEEVMEISGIAESAFEKIQDLITV